MRIVNFSKKQSDTEKVVFVIGPDFQLMGYDVEIRYYDNPIPTFRIKVACQSATVTPDNVDRMISELHLEPLKDVDVEYIVSKGYKGITPPRSAVKYKETAGDYLISSGMKALPASSNEVKTFRVRQRRRYFTENKYHPDYPVNWAGGNDSRRITKSNIEKIEYLLSTIKDFFDNNN